MKSLYKTTLLFSIVLQFIPLSIIFSQSTENIEYIKITGEVYDKNTLDSLPFTNVIINNSRGFITNEQGKFEINISKTDTLRFSHLGYFETEVILSEPDTTEALFLTILMEKQIYQIPEATIWPYKTYSEFKQALLNLDTQSKDLTNSELNIEVFREHLRAGYLVDKDSYGNYRSDMRLKYIDNKSVVLFSSNPHGGLIPALKKAFRR